MLFCRRRRKVALLLGLVASGILVLLHSHKVDDVMITSDVTHETKKTGRVLPRRETGQLVQDNLRKRRDVITRSFTPTTLGQISKSEVTNNTSVDPGTSFPKQFLNVSFLSQNMTKNTSEIFKKTHIMTIHGGGRLGNAMFQYASLVGVSSFHGYTATLASSHFLRNIFKLNAPANNYSRTQTKAMREKDPGIFDPSVQSLSHNANWTLIGYYQSWKYFGNISETIRQEFKFRDDVIKDMLKGAPVLANWTRITIGVHVRQGDMASQYELSRGYNIADIGFLNRSMNYFRKKYENPLFIVCSDSITWCKDNLKSDDTIFMKGKPEVDLATLSHCDHNIVTSGSFGWWGAWLAGGDVVYFKHFPREKTWLGRQYKAEDYYPPQWLGME